jgi:2-methylfumaryl-CoA isomerase
MGARLLDGLRIIEVSAFVAAPLGGMSLAQLGAEVIRIDPPGGGADYGRWPLAPGGASLFWAGLNQGKRSVTIDYRRPEGMQLLRRLVSSGDESGGIVLTNLPLIGALDYQALRELRSDLILVSIQGDRHGGSALDYTINCRTGLPFLTGAAGVEGPVNHVLPAWDLCTGHLATVGVLAADRKRRLTGEGTHVRLALEDIALAALSHLGYVAEAELGATRERQGNYLFGAFGRDFRTRDGERVMVMGLTIRQWRALVEATGTKESMAALGHRLDLDLTKEGDRYLAREPIAALIEPWVQARELDQVAAAFGRYGVCWGRYQTVSELVRDDASCSESNPMFCRVDQPGIGPVLASASPLSFDGERQPPRPAPRLGEHTWNTLTTMLGMTEDELRALEARRVIACSRHE